MRARCRRASVVALCGLMIGAATLVAPGCSRTKPTREQSIQRYSQELREAVSTSVAEEGRRTQMLLIVDQVEALHLRFSQETADFVEHYRRLHADYDAPRAAFDQLFSDYNARRIKARADVLELHFKLASIATAGEWDSIGKAEVKLYQKAIAARPAEDGAT